MQKLPHYLNGQVRNYLDEILKSLGEGIPVIVSSHALLQSDGEARHKMGFKPYKKPTEAFDEFLFILRDLHHADSIMQGQPERISTRTTALRLRNLMARMGEGNQFNIRALPVVIQYGSKISRPFAMAASVPEHNIYLSVEDTTPSLTFLAKKIRYAS